jgi:hypothetical protein
MKELEELFIPFKEAKQLKKLGFDMQTFGVYENNKLANPKVTLRISYTDNPVIPEEHKDRPAMFKSDNRNSSNPQWLISAPTYQQAFKWFREKYEHIATSRFNRRIGYKFEIDLHGGDSSCCTQCYETYEEAELASLRKLIEIIKKK